MLKIQCNKCSFERFKHISSCIAIALWRLPCTLWPIRQFRTFKFIFVWIANNKNMCLQMAILCKIYSSKTPEHQHCRSTLPAYVCMCVCVVMIGINFQLKFWSRPKDLNTHWISLSNTVSRSLKSNSQNYIRIMKIFALIWC